VLREERKKKDLNPGSISESLSASVAAKVGGKKKEEVDPPKHCRKEGGKKKPILSRESQPHTKRKDPIKTEGEKGFGIETRGGKAKKKKKRGEVGEWTLHRRGGCSITAIQQRDGQKAEETEEKKKKEKRETILSNPSGRPKKGKGKKGRREPLGEVCPR